MHAVQFDPFNANILYAGTDGGLAEINVSATPPAITTLNGTPPSSIVSAELYSVGPHLIGSSTPAEDARTFLAGLQDNGLTISSPSPTAQPTPALQWSVSDIVPGDAGFALYDSQNSMLAYHDNTAFPSPSFGYTTNGGASWTQSTPALVSGDVPSIFFPGLANDPSVSQFLLFGSFYIYSSTNGMMSWAQESTQNLTRGCIYPGSAPCGVQNIEFAPSNHAIGYALTGTTTYWSGSAPGGFYIWRTTRADNSTGVTWEGITGSLASAGISGTDTAGGITVDPANDNKLYLSDPSCLSTVTSDCVTLYTATANGSSTSWKAADGSSGSNPIDSPVYKVLVDNTDPTSQHLLAGTAGGLFMSSDGGADWTPYGAGGAVPNVPVLDLEQNSAGQIFVATHGAGAYELAVPTYLGDNPAESECPTGSGQKSCTVTVGPPANLSPQEGDALIVVISSVGSYSAPPSAPSGWTLLPFSNQGGAQELVQRFEVCTNVYADLYDWVFVHTYDSSDPTKYQFTLPIYEVNECGGTLKGEDVAYLVSYRGANRNVQGYMLYGYPNASSGSNTTTIPQITGVPPGVTLVNIFQAEQSDNGEDNGTKISLTDASGSPSLTTESPLTVVFPNLTADVFTGTSAERSVPILQPAASTAPSMQVFRFWCRHCRRPGPKSRPK